MEDTQIIALYLSRQEAAIGETAKKYGGYINRIAYNILRCREDTEEIASDTYLAAWNAIPPEIPRVLKHFLSRIARNLAFDRLDYITAKRRDVHMITLLSELDACLPDPRSDVEAAVDAKLAAGSVNRFTLPAASFASTAASTSERGSGRQASNSDSRVIICTSLRLAVI